MDFLGFSGDLVEDFSCADSAKSSTRSLKIPKKPKRSVGITDGSNSDGTILMETQDVASGAQPRSRRWDRESRKQLCHCKSQELRG